MPDLSYEILIQLVLAAILGFSLGIEREYVGKPAGTRTYSLVSLGATVFTIISRYGFAVSAGGDFDPSRVAAQIVTGIGFLGAGVIIFRGVKVEGLTTAAGLWVAAGIGMAIGAEMYLLAFITTAIAFVVMVVLRKFDLEIWLHKKMRNDNE